MPAHNPEQRRLQAHLAVATRDGHHGKAATAGRDLRALQLEDHIRRVVAIAPPLDPAQVDRLTVLLRAGGHHGA